MNPRTELARPQAELAPKQTGRLMIALTLLLIALTVVLVKDRDFWFGSNVDSNAADSETVPNPTPAVTPAKTAQTPVANVATAKNHIAPKTSTQAVAVRSGKNTVSPAAANPASPVVAANRVVLPPLDVEVVAGDTHRIIHSGSNVARVEIPSASNRTSAMTASMTLPRSAAERERLSTGTAPELQQTIVTSYPLLGQHMRVQGSVVLQAIVGADGIIENLRVLSGPAVLATAAQQAVREWRFKPYLQNGQAVETKARITVNFSIRISDDSKTS